MGLSGNECLVDEVIWPNLKDTLSILLIKTETFVFKNQSRFLRHFNFKNS